MIHPDLVIKQACTQPVSLHKDVQPLGKLMVGLRWFLFHDGLGATNHYEAQGFIRSRAGIEHPDIQLAFLPMATGGDSILSAASIGQHAWMTEAVHLRPTSRGGCGSPPPIRATNRGLSSTTSRRPAMWPPWYRPSS